MASGGVARNTLETLKFVNGALNNLPVDSIKENYVRSVPGACFSRVEPTPLKNPKLVGCSLPALSLLGLPASEAVRGDLVEYFSGNKLLSGSEPAAHCYCGHQFGNFAGQLGDGCAILLGEIESEKGERWELQLKGSGKTPYSRSADGRKVLRSSIREFLCSEAMHHLGVPTTRAGTCITSDNYVDRDIFYNGNVIRERATVISRIAPSFIRFGSFEIFKTRDMLTGRMGPSVGLKDLLFQLVDYVTENFYPEIHAAHAEDRAARTAAFFEEVCLRTARLVALWQCVGFCHGVLNTDNMSIVGVTIDYGPFGFLDRYDPNHICNGSDDGGRYAYNKQPEVCGWNLKKLAEALAPAGLTKEVADGGLAKYDSEFSLAYLQKMRLKLGIIHKELPEDADMMESLLETMHKTGCDFTNAFLCLSSLPLPTSNSQDWEVSQDAVVSRLLAQCATPAELVKSFKPMMRMDQLEMLSAQPPQLLAMLGFSPALLQSEMQKHHQMEKLKALSVQDKQKDDRDIWMSWLATFRKRLVLEAEVAMEGTSCEEATLKRNAVMNSNNPRIVLRNHIAQKAVEMAEQGDYSEVEKVLKMLQTPYSKDFPVAPVDVAPERELHSEEASSSEAPSQGRELSNVSRLKQYFSKPPLHAMALCVT